MPADAATDATGFMAEANAKPEDTDRTERPPPSPAIPELSEPPELPMNGITKLRPQCYRGFRPRCETQMN